MGCSQFNSTTKSFITYQASKSLVCVKVYATVHDMLEYEDTIAAFIVTSIPAAGLSGKAVFDFNTNLGLDHIPFKLKDHDLELIMQACSKLLGGFCIEGLATIIVVESHIMLILLLVLLIPLGLLLMLVLFCLCCKGCPSRVGKEDRFQGKGIRAIGAGYVTDGIRYGTSGRLDHRTGLHLQGGVADGYGVDGSKAALHAHLSGHVNASGQVHADDHNIYATVTPKVHRKGHIHLHESIHISGHVHESGEVEGHTDGHIHGSEHMNLHAGAGGHSGGHVDGHESGHEEGSEHIHLHIHASGGTYANQAALDMELEKEVQMELEKIGLGEDDMENTMREESPETEGSEGVIEVSVL